MINNTKYRKQWQHQTRKEINAGPQERKHSECKDWHPWWWYKKNRHNGQDVIKMEQILGKILLEKNF